MVQDTIRTMPTVEVKLSYMPRMSSNDAVLMPREHRDFCTFLTAIHIRNIL